MNLSFTINGRRFENFSLEDINALGLTNEEKEAAILQGRKPKVSAECRRRIYNRATAETQMNMATAAALISAKAADDR